MPRRAGIGGIGGGLGAVGLQAQQAARERAQDAGDYLQEKSRKQMSEKCEMFKEALEAFAQKHRQEIVKNPEFRSKFNAMCHSIGVDPLNSQKGFWGALGMGDFYYELGVQLVEVCLEQRPRTGGIDSLDEVLSLLQKKRGSKSQVITLEDVERSLKSIKELGKGMEMITIGGKRMVQSVPLELSKDHTAVLEAAKASSHTSVPLLVANLGWTQERASTGLDFMVAEGMGWVDTQAGGEGGWPEVWFPAFFLSQGTQAAP